MGAKVSVEMKNAIQGLRDKIYATPYEAAHSNKISPSTVYRSRLYLDWIQELSEAEHAAIKVAIAKYAKNEKAKEKAKLEGATK